MGEQRRYEEKITTYYASPAPASASISWFASQLTTATVEVSKPRWILREIDVLFLEKISSEASELRAVSPSHDPEELQHGGKTKLLRKFMHNCTVV
jgi:hypothetical protein